MERVGMSDERDVPRLTPYELVFDQPGFEEDRFPAMRDEARDRGADSRVPDEFLSLGTVGGLLQDLMPDGAGGLEFRSYGLLLFHAFHFWAAGKQLYVLDEALARELAGEPPVVGSWELVPPHPAGYLQLPRNLFWARIDESAQAEPVDGFFWALIGDEDPMHPPYTRLDVLLVLGLRADRPGFATIPSSSELVAAPLGHWADTSAREGGIDFANVLPGGELGGLLGLETEPEVLRLVSLVFWYAAAHPSAVAEAEPPGSVGEPALHALPPTTLAFHRIRGVGSDG